MRGKEAHLQRTITAYLRMMLPTDVFFTAFPAGGGGKVRGAQLKAMGLAPGVPDLLFIYQGKTRWIELKSDTGRVSPVQHDTFCRLYDAGCGNVVVCKTLDEVISTLKTWGIPGRFKARVDVRAA
jgi:hypothetical protein